MYLSAKRHLQIATGLTDLFAGIAWPHLDQVMRGIKRVEAEKGTDKRERLLYLHWFWKMHGPQQKMSITPRWYGVHALCVSLFLRGERTVPSDEDLWIATVPIDEDLWMIVPSDEDLYTWLYRISLQYLSILCIKIKQSKMDPFRKGEAWRMAHWWPDLRKTPYGIFCEYWVWCIFDKLYLRAASFRLIAHFALEVAQPTLFVINHSKWEIMV